MNTGHGGAPRRTFSSVSLGAVYSAWQDGGTLMGRVTGDGVKEENRAKSWRVFVLRGVDYKLDVVRSNAGREVSR